MNVIPSESDLLYPKPECKVGQIICTTEIGDSHAGMLLLCTGTMMGRRNDLYEFVSGFQPEKPFYVRVEELPEHKVLGWAILNNKRKELYDERFLEDARELARKMNQYQFLAQELLDPINGNIHFEVMRYDRSDSLTEKNCF